MTKELLEQYPDICAEIEELKAKDSAAEADAETDMKERTKDNEN